MNVGLGLYFLAAVLPYCSGMLGSVTERGYQQARWFTVCLLAAGFVGAAVFK